MNVDGFCCWCCDEMILIEGLAMRKSLSLCGWSWRVECSSRLNFVGDVVVVVVVG